MAYHNTSKITDSEYLWHYSKVRTWLNSSFLSSMNSLEKTTLISVDTLEQWWGNEHISNDKVFLLSEKEVEEYMPKEEDRICELTQYAKTQAAEEQYGIEQVWYLKDYGTRYFHVKCVDNEDGDFTQINTSGSFYKGYVRPAIWVDLDAAYFWQ